MGDDQGRPFRVATHDVEQRGQAPGGDGRRWLRLWPGREVFAAVRAPGIPVSFDPNIRPELLTDESYLQASREIVDGARIVLASEGELQGFVGGGTDEECARRLLADRAQVVVVKRGARGASLLGAGPWL